MLEVRNLMSTHNLLLPYLRSLKQDIHRHIMLGNPSNVGHAMTLADSADSAMWFSGSLQRLLQNMPAHSYHHRESHGGGPRGNSGYAPMELGAAAAADA